MPQVIVLLLILLLSMYQGDKYMLPAAGQYDKHTLGWFIHLGMGKEHICGIPSLQLRGNASIFKEAVRPSSYQDGRTMYVDYCSQDYMYIGPDTSNRPIIPSNIINPNQGTVWTATTVPQHGNVDELMGCLTGVRKPIDASQCT